MISKKGQGISLNVIVVAAIALIVMVVLILVFTGKIGDFTEKTNTCQSKQGTCQLADSNGEFCAGTLSTQIPEMCDLDGDGEQDEDYRCCLNIG